MPTMTSRSRTFLAFVEEARALLEPARPHDRMVTSDVTPSKLDSADTSLEMFRSFLQRAHGLAPITPSAPNTDDSHRLEAFRSFVALAGQLPRSDDEPSSTSLTLTAFLDFTASACRLVREEVLEDVSRILVAAGPLLADAPPIDILAAAHLSYAENAYTRLLAWMLDPQENPSGAMRLQRRVVEWLGLDPALVDRACSPRVQVQLDAGGVLDLLLDYPTASIIIETKTGTQEHLVGRLGVPQTVHYPKAVGAQFGGREPKVLATVLLAPYRLSPESDSAIPMTFADVALLLAGEVGNPSLPTSMREALRQIALHFLDEAVPRGGSLAEALRHVGRRLAANDVDDWWLEDLGSLRRIRDLVKVRYSR